MVDGVIHVVLVRWAATAPPDVVERFDAAVGSVRDTVPGVVEITHGPSVSTEGLEQGYGYGLYVRFTDAAARDAYLPTPRTDRSPTSSRRSPTPSWSSICLRTASGVVRA